MSSKKDIQPSAHQFACLYLILTTVPIETYETFIILDPSVKFRYCYPSDRERQGFKCLKKNHSQLGRENCTSFLPCPQDFHQHRSAPSPSLAFSSSLPPFSSLTELSWVLSLHHLVAVYGTEDGVWNPMHKLHHCSSTSILFPILISKQGLTGLSCLVLHLRTLNLSPPRAAAKRLAQAGQTTPVLNNHSRCPATLLGQFTPPLFLYKQTLCVSDSCYIHLHSTV